MNREKLQEVLDTFKNKRINNIIDPTTELLTNVVIVFDDPDSDKDIVPYIKVKSAIIVTEEAMNDNNLDLKEYVINQLLYSKINEVSDKIGSILHIKNDLFNFTYTDLYDFGSTLTTEFYVN